MADNVDTDMLEEALGALSESIGLSTKEFVEGGFLDLVTYASDKDAIITRLNAIDVVDADDDIDSIAERIVAINEVLTADADALTALTDSITALNDRAQTIEDTAAVVRTDLDGVISSAQANTDAIAVLNGDDQTEGSVAKAVLDATGGDIDELKDSVAANATEIGRVANLVDDTEDADGNTVKGIGSRTTDLEAGLSTEITDRIAAVEAAIAESKAYFDDNKVKADTMDKLVITNKFRVALGLPEEEAE